METLGQDRMRSLKTNYRRNKIKLAILVSLALALLSCTAFLTIRIISIKNAAIRENTHYITEAEAEEQTADQRLSEIRARYDELKAENAALKAELKALTGGN